MIAIVDYGVGNVFSLSSSLNYLGIDNIITSDKGVLNKADRLILPGVGAFSDAMSKLKSTGMAAVVKTQAQEGKPLMGICLGMQLLFEYSFEYGVHEGLGLLPGKIVSIENALKRNGTVLKVPHMGWNSLQLKQHAPLLKRTKEGDYMYYVHSFYASGCEEYVAAQSQYGIMIPGTVVCGNVMGCQFHPEKSGQAGLRILESFNEI